MKFKVSGLSATDDQTKAMTMAWDLLMDDADLMVLSGAAGTGKTLTTSEIIQMAEGEGYYVHVTAPTHKACSVLRETGVPNVETIHKLMGCTVENDGRGGTFVQQTKPPKVEQDSLIVVDESSMLDSPMLKIILESSIDFNAKVIFVGDSEQLLPIKEESSPVFEILIGSNPIKVRNVP
jgi:exodeoxyribonuclease V